MINWEKTFAELAESVSKFALALRVSLGVTPEAPDRRAQGWLQCRLLKELLQQTPRRRWMSSGDERSLHVMVEGPP